MYKQRGCRSKTDLSQFQTSKTNYSLESLTTDGKCINIDVHLFVTLIFFNLLVRTF